MIIVTIQWRSSYSRIQIHLASRGASLGERLVAILTDAAGALKGLFEAQKRLAGNKPSFANSGGFKRRSEFPKSRVHTYLDSLAHAQN